MTTAFAEKTLDLIIPRMGEGLREVKIIKLLKMPGDVIASDEIIYEMETNKAIVSVEAEVAGILAEWCAEEGEMLAIGEIIGKMQIDNIKSEASVGQLPEVRGISPRVRAYCKSHYISQSEMLTIPISEKKLSETDVENYLKTKTLSKSLQYHDAEFNAKQQGLIRNFKKSQHSVISSTMVGTIDIHNLRLAMRNLNQTQVPVSEALTLAYCIAVLASSHAKFRSLVLNEKQYREFQQINLGIAVQTNTNDLVTTTIASANTLNFADFIKIANQQVLETKNGMDTKLALPNVIISYMGQTGIISGTPILVEPAVAILFLGSSYNSNDKLVAQLSMTFDHRIINGMDAARFIQAINEWITQHACASVKTVVQSDLKNWLLNKLSKLLNTGAENINVSESLGLQGFDSIMASELAEQLSSFLNKSISPTLFWEYPNVEAIVKALQQDGKSIPLMVEQAAKADDIAIIGISARFPQAPDLETFWQNLENQHDAITEIPATRWDWQKYYGNPHLEDNKTQIKWGGFIEDIDAFDAKFFGISPAEAKFMDPQQRIFMEGVWDAIADAGYEPSQFKGTNTGVFVGVSMNEYAYLIKDSGVAIDGCFATGWSHSMMANKISFHLGLHGPSEAIDTACSSSLSALHNAVNNLKNGNCHVAIVGGVNLLLSPDFYIAFNSAGMLSKDGRCKTFDAKANGYVRGEGCGVLILKSLTAAQQQGDRIYGVIKGIGVNHGGRANSLTSPNPLAQAELIAKVYQNSGINPESISFIETHGTGTKLGDPIEINGLKNAFAVLTTTPSAQPYCALGAVKTNIGHLESAAGIAGVIKVLLAMKYKRLPGLVHYKNLNPNIDLQNSPFYILSKTRDWTLTEKQPLRIAGVSSFGFGGTNAHVAIAEYEKHSSHAVQRNALPRPHFTKESHWFK